MQTRHQPQNWKYITYCNTARGVNHGHGQHAQKIWWSLEVVLEICSWKIYRTTDTVGEIIMHGSCSATQLSCSCYCLFRWLVVYRILFCVWADLNLRILSYIDMMFTISEPFRETYMRPNVRCTSFCFREVRSLVTCLLLFSTLLQYVFLVGGKYKIYWNSKKLVAWRAYRHFLQRTFSSTGSVTDIFILHHSRLRVNKTMVSVGWV